jgi:hypothetical protein
LVDFTPRQLHRWALVGVFGEHLMKRFFLSIAGAIIIQLLVVVFWSVSKQWNLPAVWDYVVAPGMLPTNFYIDSGPPKNVVVVCFLVNIGIYALLSYAAFRVVGRMRRN